MRKMIVSVLVVIFVVACCGCATEKRSQGVPAYDEHLGAEGTGQLGTAPERVVGDTAGSIDPELPQYLYNPVEMQDAPELEYYNNMFGVDVPYPAGWHIYAKDYTAVCFYPDPSDTEWAEYSVCMFSDPAMEMEAAAFYPETVGSFYQHMAPLMFTMVDGTYYYGQKSGTVMTSYPDAEIAEDLVGVSDVSFLTKFSISEAGGTYVRRRVVNAYYIYAEKARSGFLQVAGPDGEEERMQLLARYLVSRICSASEEPALIVNTKSVELQVGTNSFSFALPSQFAENSYFPDSPSRRALGDLLDITDGKVFAVPSGGDAFALMSICVCVGPSTEEIQDICDWGTDFNTVGRPLLNMNLRDISEDGGIPLDVTDEKGQVTQYLGSEDIEVCHLSALHLWSKQHWLDTERCRYLVVPVPDPARRVEYYRISAGDYNIYLQFQGNWMGQDKAMNTLLALFQKTASLA